MGYPVINDIHIAALLMMEGEEVCSAKVQVSYVSEGSTRWGVEVPVLSKRHL